MSPTLSGRGIARNSAINVVGSLFPLLAALILVPLLIEKLGNARFGLLTIGWVLVGYMAVLDLGLGRALTRAVAERQGTEKESEVPYLVRRTLGVAAAAGVVLGIVLALVCGFFVDRVLDIPTELREEARLGFIGLACAVPAVVSTAVLTGVLEAHQRFALLNLVRIPAGVAIFAGPWLASLAAPRLDAALLALALVRLATWVAYGRLVLRVMERYAFVPSVRTTIRPLLAMGSWLTVSSVVGPVMVYFDRFFIAAAISAEAVTYYATPFDLVSRISTFPIAFMAVIFPAMAAFVHNDPGRAAAYFGYALKGLGVTLFPIVALVVLFAPEALSWWLGQDFALKGGDVLRFLAVGVMVNVMATVPYNLIQSAGRTDVTAALHLAELPLYVLVLWWLVDSMGILGGALAWSLRVGVDALCLFLLSGRIVPAVARLAGLALLATGGEAAILASLFGVEGWDMKLLVAGGALGASGVLAWYWGRRWWTVDEATRAGGVP